jgi:DNA-binding response OmpR family regulator
MTLMRAPRVLIVDDEPLVCEMLREFLDAEGWEVACAGDGVAALDAGAADVALVDVILPGGMSGLELAAALEAAGTRVVIMSGHPDAVGDAERDGRPILAKPFKVAQVLAQLRRLVAA